MDAYFHRAQIEEDIKSRALDAIFNDPNPYPGQLILGVSGVGKSYLIKEVAKQLDDIANVNVGLFSIDFKNPYRPLVACTLEVLSKLPGRNPEFLKTFRKKLNDNHFSKVSRLIGALWRDFGDLAHLRETSKEISNLIHDATKNAIPKDVLQNRLTEQPDLPEEVIFSLFSSFSEIYLNERFILIFDQLEFAPDRVIYGFESLIRMIHHGRLNNLHIVGVVNTEVNDGLNFVTKHLPILKALDCPEYEIPTLELQETRDYLDFFVGTRVPVHISDSVHQITGGRIIFESVFASKYDRDGIQSINNLKNIPREKYGAILDLLFDDLPTDSLNICRVLSLLPGNIALSLTNLSEMLNINNLERLNNILQPLVRRGILQKLDNEYWFKHELYRTYLFDKVDAPLKEEYAEKLLLPYLYKNEDSIDILNFNILLSAILPLTEQWEDAGHYNIKLAEYWRMTGSLSESLECCNTTLNISLTKGPNEITASAMNTKALVYIELGKYSAAEELLLHANRINVETGHTDHEATTYHNLAVLYAKLKLYEPAIKMNLKSLEMTDSNENKTSQISSLNSMGLRLFDLGKFDEAEELFNNILPNTRDIGDKNLEAAVLNNIALVKGAIGKPEEALNMYDQVVDICREIGAISGITTALKNKADAYRSLERNDMAIEIYLEVIPIIRDSGNIVKEADACNDLAEIYVICNDNQNALKYYLRAHELAILTDDNDLISATLTNLGIYYFNNKDYLNSKLRLEQAIKICQENDIPAAKFIENFIKIIEANYL
jgi:tetratricopeptide (TPR) repeat protein